MKLPNKKIVFLASCLLLLLAPPVFAAQIFFGTGNKEVAIDEKFEVGVFLDTQRESINAVEGQIVFPSDSFDFQGFYTGNSALTFWIRQPVLVSQGVVSFAGIVPGGFVGSKEYLFSLILTATQKGSSVISARSEKILLNDGNGSQAPITKAPLHLTVLEKASSQSFVPLYDATDPEVFKPQIGQDQNIFNGKYFLAFATQDKGSGIDHYEVMEMDQTGSFKSVFSKSEWVATQSPYLLQNQSLESVVYVKAVDMAGNQRVVTLQAYHAVPLYENYFFWITIIIMGLWSIKYKLWGKNQP